MSFKTKHEGAAHTAEEFVMAAIHLAEKCSDNRFVAPIMVCFAFAIELHLKAILAEDDKDPQREHNLWNLYAMLSDRHKERTFRLYKELCGEIEMVDFEAEILRWKDTFVNTRYWHDESGKEAAYFDFSNFVPNLAISLNNIYAHTKHFPRFQFPQLTNPKQSHKQSDHDILS